MTIFNRLLIVAVATFSTLTALADNYLAKTVTVSTSKASTDMKLLGTTADGYQIWSCLNSIGGGTETKWTIDGTAVSKDESYFYGGPNDFYELSTSFGQTGNRLLASQTSLYQFLKVNSQSSAQLFFATSDAAKIYHEGISLAPKITLTVNSGYEYKENALAKKVDFSAKDIQAEAVSKLVLKYSYDGGETWDSTTTEASSIAMTLQALHPLSAEKVRYKLALYPKPEYRAVTEALYESAETEDFDISSRNRIVYKASNVTMNTYRGNSEDGTSGGIDKVNPDTKCDFLGVSGKGCQIWSKKGSDYYFAYVDWQVDGGTTQSRQIGSEGFAANTIYTLEDFTVKPTFYPRNVCCGTDYTHFVKVNGQKSVYYFSWKYDESSTSDFNPTEFKVDGKCTIAPTSDDYYYNEVTGSALCHELSYSAMNANSVMLEKALVEISCDGGKTWIDGATISTFNGSDNVYTGEVTITNIPINATKVRYRMTLVPKNDYKIICDGWSYESKDYDVKLPTDDYTNVLVYKRVISEDDLIAGDTYLIVNKSNKKALGYQNAHNRKAEDVDISGLKVKIGQNRIATSKSTATDATVSEFILGGEAGSWTFRDKAVKGTQYLYAAGDMSDSYYYLETTTQNTDAKKATITLSSTGDAIITFGGNAASNTIGYNSASKFFTCYPQENAPANIQGVQLYRKVSTFTISSVGYGTFYTDDAYTMPNYVTGYTVTLKDDNTIQLNEAYTTGNAVPARTGLLLKGPAGSYDVLAVSSTETAPTDNLLYGSVINATTTATGDAKYYKLSLGTDNKAGFYYGAKDGAAFTNKAYKAYLALPAAAASQVRGFAFDDLDGTTSVLDAVITPSNTNAPARIYDLNGRRISTLRGAQKGVYIVNGQKVMVK